MVTAKLPNMARLINAAGESLENDPWHAYNHKDDSKDGDKYANNGDQQDYSLLTLQQWQDIPEAQGTQLLTSDGKLGLQLPGDMTAQQLIDDLIDGGGDGEGDMKILDKFALLQINIPTFKDGRCFSLAARLRTQHKYTGELRAAGNYMPDQIFFMTRCGFTSFLVETELDADALSKILKPFSEVYQSSVDDMATVIDKRRSNS